MKKSSIVRSVAVIIVAAVVLLLVTRPGGSTGVITYETENVLKQDISLNVSASGTLIPSNRKDVVASTQAKVVKVYVNVGDVVKSGQTLAKLDDYTLQNNLKKAQYNYNSSIYNLKQAKAATVQDANRIMQLQQLVNSAYVDVQNAQRALSNDPIVKSPIDGVVSSVNLTVGNTPSQSSPAFVVQSKDSFVVKLSVNQVDIEKVIVGQDVALTFSASQKVRSGKITKIYPSAVTSTSASSGSTSTTGVVSYYVETSIEDSEGLKPDMTVDAKIAIASKSGVLTVPSASLTQKDGKYYVTTVTYEQNGSVRTPITKEVEVQIGINNNTNAEVIAGLSEGDTVVINTESDTNTTSTGFRGPFSGSSNN